MARSRLGARGIDSVPAWRNLNRIPAKSELGARGIDPGSEPGSSPGDWKYHEHLTELSKLLSNEYFKYWPVKPLPPIRLKVKFFTLLRMACRKKPKNLLQNCTIIELWSYNIIYKKPNCRPTQFRRWFIGIRVIFPLHVVILIISLIFRAPNFMGNPLCRYPCVLWEMIGWKGLDWRTICKKVRI